MGFDYKNASKEELQAKYKEIAEKSGDYQLFTKKELNYLPEVLQEGEEILAFTSGFMEEDTWLIVLTDKRIIFLNKGMIFGLKQMVIPLDRINSVSGETGLVFGKIYIEDGAKERVIKNVMKHTVKPFTNMVMDAIENYKKKFSNDVSNTQLEQKQDPYEQLEKLASLKDKGIITEEEFNKAKKNILGI